MTKNADFPNIARGVARAIIRTLVFSAIMTLALMLPSGDWGWVMGWAYIGVFVIIQTIYVITLLNTNPDLLVERADVQENTKDWDRPLSFLVALLGPLLMWLTAGLDKAFGWSPALPSWLQIGGLVVTFLSSLLPIWAMAANRYFSGTVRIQEERGHQVVDGGPYRFVRHPGYAGSALYNLSTPLALNTLWTFVPALLTTGILVLRTALEEKTLQEELDSYRAYAARVRYRLLPGIW